ncbi:unnamed protein product [Paramecium sonneborni]|uniref:MORN repeat protein n=1 Tax=Paramecium sonneborni TaxID=65129 RepID=A0A8S1RG35_9CILI|nr:unnamed protein product [Paramecium sonneborni]
MEKQIYQLEQCIQQLQLKMLTDNILYSPEIIPEHLRLMDIPPFIRAKLKAIQINPNLEKYEAQFQYAKNVGLNRMYQGQWYNEKKNGRGQEYNEKDKKFFYGYYKDGVFVQGLIITENYLFEGETQDDQFLRGTLVYLDERVFSGKFQQGELNDENGNFRSNTEKYVGGFRNGQKYGKGKYENNDFTYEGEFVEDKICGQGILIEKKNGWRQEGQFKDGLLDGKGVIIRSLGDYYEGQFKQGLRHGQGTLKREGQTYQGSFIEGKLDGWVQMTQDKRVYKCFFELGEENKNKRQLIS